MQKLWRIRLAAVCLVILLSSCGGNEADGTGRRTGSYDDDGMLGFSNTNPNLPTSPTYHTYAEDRELVLQTLQEFPEVRNPRIVFNGTKLTLHVDLAGDLNAAEAEELESRLRDRLAYMLPRYDILVDLSE